MKFYVILWTCLLWLPFQLSSQEANYRLDIEVFIADEGSDLFIPLQTYSYTLASEAFRQSINLPSTAGRIRLQTYLMSGLNKVNIYDLLVNGVKSRDQESFIIENPLAWMQRGEPLMIVLADKPYSYYKLNVPIQWSSPTERTTLPQAYGSANYSAALLSTPGANQAASQKTYIPPGFAIQIEARKDLPNLQNFAVLQSLGAVYYREDPSWYRVRVGTFASREEAEEKLYTIHKMQHGAFSKAFLTGEEGGYVVQLAGGGIPAATAVPQGYDDATAGRIKGAAAQATTDLVAKGGQATQPPVPQSYEEPSRPSTLAERAPRFPDWYYNANVNVTAPEPKSADIIVNSPLPKGYESAGERLTPKGGVSAPQPGYYVQTGAFGNYDNAQRYHQNLTRQGVSNAQIVEAKKSGTETIYRIWIGPYRTQATAQNQQQLMAKNMKISGTVVSGSGN